MSCSTSESKLPDIPTDAERALAAILPATHRFSEMVKKSIVQKESVTHRLNVTVKRGKLEVVQLIIDEKFPVEIQEDS